MKVDSKIRLTVQEYKTLQKAHGICKKVAIYAPGPEDASLASSASGVCAHLLEVVANTNIATPKFKTAAAVAPTAYPKFPKTDQFARKLTEIM